MALDVKVKIIKSHITGEKVACARLVNQPTMEFVDFCDFVAEGSTVTSADVMAVMRQIEDKLPLLFALNQKVRISPSGLMLRPAVKGSLTQSELKERLMERAKQDASIDVDRPLVETDLSVKDLTASIAMSLPEKLEKAIVSGATFERE